MTKKITTPLTLADLMASPVLNEEELEELRRKAWTEQGLFIAHPWDRRLTPLEAKLVRQLAERLYGYGEV